MGKRIRRVVGILLVLTAVLITQLPVPHMSAASPDDFQIDNKTLLKYTGTDSTVSVSDTVKIIGEEAFAGNLTLNTVSCGNNVKKIMHGAFSNCTYLSKVELPDSVEFIDSAAFSGCENLSHISIGRNVSELGQGVFAGCNFVNTVSIDENNTHLVMDNGALYNHDKSILYAYFGEKHNSDFTILDSVKKIYSYAFWGNQDLESITISSSIKEIPGYAFSNCKNLQNITIPYSVNNIDAKAFENCISLREATIPGSVNSIHPTAFDGCNRLKIVADPGTVADNFAQGLIKTEVEITEEEDTKEVVVSSKSGDVSDNDIEENNNEQIVNRNLKDASEDPSNVEYMPKKDPLSGLEEDSVVAKTIIVDGNAVLFLNRDVTINQGMVIAEQNDEETAFSSSDDENGEVIYDPQKGGYLPKYTVVNDKIASQAFYAARDIDDYEIPSEIKKIGDFSFARSNIRDLKIPLGVTQIGYAAFYCCDKLENVKIPSSVTDINAYAFENTPWITNWKSNTDSSDYLVVGDNILLAYKGSNTNIEIPAGVKKIAPECFRGHTEIESVFLPDSLKEIGEDAFRECNRLSMITGGNYIEKIEDRAFMECPITSYAIPSTVKKIGLRALDFSETGMEDNEKVILFNGTVLPELAYGNASKRLQNEDYRKDALYNVLFAVVPESVTEYENTVLDNNRGFSGMILSIEKDKDGQETGDVVVKENYIFSELVMQQMPQKVTIRGKEYTIKDFDKLKLTQSNEMESNEKKQEVTVRFNQKETTDFAASFSENECVGTLYITENDNVTQEMQNAYRELFGDSTPMMKGYSITLMDETNTFPLTKFGKAVLSVEMKIPKDITGDTYHVICMDDDGQLEEVDTKVDKEEGSLTFRASHLSDYAVYATDNKTTTLNLKNGRLVKNYKMDDSPNTGDYSLPAKYFAALAIMLIGLICMFYRKRSKVTT